MQICFTIKCFCTVSNIFLSQTSVVGIYFFLQLKASFENSRKTTFSIMSNNIVFLYFTGNHVRQNLLSIHIELKGYSDTMQNIKSLSITERKTGCGNDMVLELVLVKYISLVTQLSSSEGHSPIFCPWRCFESVVSRSTPCTFTPCMQPENPCLSQKFVLKIM